MLTCNLQYSNRNTQEHKFSSSQLLADIYLFKINNGNTSKICSLLTIETPKRRQWRQLSHIVLDFQQKKWWLGIFLYISIFMHFIEIYVVTDAIDVVLVFLLLTLSMFHTFF